MKKILLIGCGHMGSTLLNAWYKKTSFKFSVVDPKTYKILKKKYAKKISIYKSIEKINNFDQFNIIIFAVKPQIAKQIISQFSFIDNKKILFLSIIAGKKINFIENNLLNPHQVIRIMPNMPAFVEKGMTCLISNNLTSKRNKIIAGNLFKTVGKIIWLDKELDIDKVTAVSGSGPAYFFLFIEHLLSQAIKLGLKKKIALELIYQTALGSIHLLLKSKRSAEELRKSIAVKGGTTEAAINIFNKKEQFKKIIGQALKAAYNRSKKLGST